jgi:hypothetical protein
VSGDEAEVGGLVLAILEAVYRTGRARCEQEAAARGISLEQLAAAAVAGALAGRAGQAGGRVKARRRSTRIRGRG